MSENRNALDMSMSTIMRWRCFLVAFVPCVLALWPLPREYEQGDGVLRLSNAFAFDLACSLERHAPADLLAAIDQTLSYVHHDRHRPLVPDRGASLRGAVSRAPVLDSVALWLAPDGPCRSTAYEPPSIATEATRPLHERQEAFTLEIDQLGRKARLVAETSLGLFRGLQAFSQLIYTLPGRTTAADVRQLVLDSAEDIRYLHAPLHISDSPAFTWRGVHLDTSRNFYRIETIEKLILSASMIGYSVFHWHITDSHSWPLDVPGFPELAAKGKNDEGQVYSAQQVRDLEAYANARGIDLVLEVDMPGHTGSIGESHPEHIACFHKQPWSTYAAEPGGPGQVRIASATTTNFVNDVLRGILPLSSSKYFSTGGDEIQMRCFQHDEETQAALKAQGIDIKEALRRFTNATHSVLLEGGKTPVVWEELAIKQSIDLHEDTLVAVWTNSKQVRKALERGLRVILAPSDYLYLDCGQGGWLGNPRWWWQKSSWCNFAPWHRIYSLDPMQGVASPQRSLIQGGQVQLWSEQADDTNIEQLYWPRAAAAVEVFWHGGKLGRERSYSEALPRLHDLRYRMVQRGIRAIPLQPHWCALRPGECDAQGGQVMQLFS